MSRDAPDRVLAAAVALLPAGRREWGTAMRAELAGIGGRGERARFALGCARAVVSQPAVLRGALHPLLTVGAVVAVLAWTSPVAYAPLRCGLIGTVLVLVAVAWLGRRPGLLGPVHHGWPARIVRSGGYLLVAAVTLAALASMRSHDNPGEQVRNGVPIFTTVLTGYLLGLLAVTARRLADGRVLTTAATAGGAAGILWTTAVLAAPPVPASAGLAAALTAGAAILAAGVNTGRRRLLAALCAAAVTVLVVIVAVYGLSRYGSATLIPDLAPVALTPADDLAQSRSELVDPYLALLLLGGLLAGGLGLVSLLGPDARSGHVAVA